MVFNAKKDNYGWHVDVNQGAINAFNGWKSGVEQTKVVANLQVDISAGSLIFQGALLATSADTITFDAADPVLTRRDLIAHNGTSFEILKGIAADDTSSIAKPPNYDIQAYVIVGLVEIRPGVTELDETDIYDYRCSAIESGEGAGETAFMYLGY